MIFLCFVSEYMDDLLNDWLNFNETGKICYLKRLEAFTN